MDGRRASAATIIPTLIAGLAMMLLLPDTIRPGFISPRRWMGVLLAAYLAGIILRLVIRGLDFSRSPAGPPMPSLPGSPPSPPRAVLRERYVLSLRTRAASASMSTGLTRWASKPAAAARSWSECCP